MLHAVVHSILKFHAVSILPAIIAAGGALVGGAIANRSNRKVADQTNQQTREIHDQNTALQREFAQMGIRWKVEDAKAAGLHPLYALGAQTPQFSPSIPAFVTPDQSALGRSVSEAGQHLGRAIQAQQSPAERMAQSLSLAHQRASLEREVALTQYYDSMTARNRQEANQSLGIPDGTVTVGDLTGIPGQVKTMPDEVTSHAPGDQSKTAGIHPGWREYTFGADRRGPVRLILPVNDEGWSEGLGELPIAMYPLVYRANLEKYGADHARRVLEYIMYGKKGRPYRGATGSW